MPEKTHVVVKYVRDWADEFDTYGLAVYSIGEWNAKKLELDIFYNQAQKNDLEVSASGFGTNEEHTFESAKDLLSSSEEIFCTEEQAHAVLETIGVSFGTLPCISYQTNIDGEYDYQEWSF